MIFDPVIFDSVIFSAEAGTPAAIAAVTSGSPGKPRRTIIRNGRRYRVTKAEELALVDSWIAELEEKQEVLETKLEEVKAEEAEAPKPTKRKRIEPYKASPIPSIMAEIKANEKLIREAYRRKRERDEMLDEEDAITIIMRML